jgi:hypothetical protein
MRKICSDNRGHFRKALPKLLQSFEFGSCFAIFWICQNSAFWIVLYPCPTGAFIEIVHDLMTPHDAFDDNGAGNEDCESGSALLKAPDKVRPVPCFGYCTNVDPRPRNRAGSLRWLRRTDLRPWLPAKE